jgi:hypothetical protein
MHVSSAIFAANPLRISEPRRDTAIDALRPFQGHERASMFVQLKVTAVKLSRLGGHDADVYEYACPAESLQTSSCDLLKWIDAGDGNPTNSGPDERIDTGRSLSMMAAWLEIDVARGALCRVGCSIEGSYFRVGSAESGMIALPYDSPTAHDHRPDQRIGFDLSTSSQGQ